MQQQNNDQQPGSVAGKMSLFNILLEYYWFIIFVAAMVRKLYEAHQVRSEVLNHWNKPEDPFQSYRRNSYSSKVNLIWKHKGKGVKIGFGNWFLFVSFKVRIPDEVQCPTKRWRWRVDFVRFTSLPEMPLIIFSNIFLLRAAGSQRGVGTYSDERTRVIDESPAVQREENAPPTECSGTLP